MRGWVEPYRISVGLGLRQLARRRHLREAVIRVVVPMDPSRYLELPWAIRAVNALVEGVNANITLHICYGNRYGKPSFEGSYRYLFPKVLEAKVHAISLEFARRGEDDLALFKEFNVPFALGFGVIDVKTHDVESPGTS